LVPIWGRSRVDYSLLIFSCFLSMSNMAPKSLLHFSRCSIDPYKHMERHCKMAWLQACSCMRALEEAYVCTRFYMLMVVMHRAFRKGRRRLTAFGFGCGLMDWIIVIPRCDTHVLAWSMLWSGSWVLRRTAMETPLLLFFTLDSGKGGNPGYYLEHSTLLVFLCSNSIIIWSQERP